MIRPKENLNYLDLDEVSVGRLRRHEIVGDILDRSTLLPKTVVYEDIDDDFRRWADEELEIISDEGKRFPTMVLFSNQRFSEYSQSWDYTDDNNNLILNFKSITRENNPQYGKIQAGLWNIPGDRFYKMKRIKVLDDNGTESYLDLKMRQPMAVDLVYKLTIFTTKYNKINEFNILVNKKFMARQCYIRPNNHFMPMTLEGISDESQYNIDDRQFYSQSYNIKVMGYIIEEDDYRIEETPLKLGVNFTGFTKIKKKIPTVEINECESESKNGYIYEPITLSIDFPVCKNKSEFKIDTNFHFTDDELVNIQKNYRIIVNDVELEDKTDFKLFDNDIIQVIIKRRNPIKESRLVLNGYNPDNVQKLEDYNNELKKA